MKYAVPVSDGGLATHFGHCADFAIFDIEEAEKRILKQELIPAPEHQPGLLPVWLAEQGVSVVIAGGMGMRAQNLLEENQIKVVIGASEDNPEKAVQLYLEGNLAIGDNVCDH